jgi:filamentous haemagglutinin family N-terminal domain
MNKRLHRIVFNKARGMLMVVSELARGCTGSAASSGIGHALQRLVCRVGALSLALWLASGAVTVQAAGIVADASAPAKQQPTVISSANGTTQVNIQTPSAGGVSRNTYSQFDVGRDGVILNNSHKNASTQIGGMVTANPWLAKGEAKVILNEVNARNPSQLNGYIEVAGQKADVVIASPSGITCDGCGFINAGRATLTTGTAQMQDGRITRYQVERGEIAVNGSGLDASRQTHTDIIARAVQVNAAIHAQDLRVTAGRNAVDAAHEKVTALAGSGSAKPALALDVAQVGGMYAGKIRLLGTEKGVGVRNAGNIGAEAGAVTLSADGRIENSGNITAQQDIRLTTNENLTSSGTVYAGGNAAVTAAGALHHDGFLAGAGSVKVEADHVTGTSRSVLAAGLNADGSVADRGDLTVTSRGQLSSQGQHQAAGDARLTGSGLDLHGSQTAGRNVTLNAQGKDVITAQATVGARRSLTVQQAATIDNRGGALGGETLALDARRLLNAGGKLVQTGTNDLTLALRDGLDNQDGAISSNAKRFTIDTTTLNNTRGQLLHGGEQFTVSASSVQGNGGELFSSGSLTLSAGQLQMDDSVTQAQRLTVNADSLSHRSGTMLQIGDDAMSLTLRGGLDNQDGQIIAQNGGLTFSAAQVNNRQGTLAAAGALTGKSTAFDNTDGLIQTNAALTLDTQGQTLINQQGSERGGIFSGGSLTLNSGELNNAQGLIASGSDISIDTQGQALNNQNGAIQAAGQAALRVSELDNRRGSLAGGAIDVQATALLNQDGELLSPGDIQIAAGLTDNTAGLMRSGGTLSVTAQSLLNDATSGEDRGIEGDTVSIVSQTVSNAEGAMRAGRQLALNVTTALNNALGLLSAERQLDVSGGKTLSVTNTGGTLIADEGVGLTARDLSGDGEILSLGDLALTLAQAFTNSGRVIAVGNANISVAKAVTNNAQIQAGGTLTLAANKLTNNADSEISAGENHLIIKNAVTNKGLLDGGLTWIESGSLTNAPSGRIYGDHVAIATGTLDNSGNGKKAPVIAARARLDIGAQTVTNREHGLIYSDGDMAIGGTLDENHMASGQAQLIDNHSARIEAGGSLRLDVATLNNINDHLSTKIVTTETSKRHEMTYQGDIVRYDWSEVDLSKTDKYGVHDAQTPDGKGGKEFYEYDYTRKVQETQVTRSDPGQIIAGGNMAITAGQITNRDSQIVAGGTLSALAGRIDNEATTGVRITTDTGTQTRWYAKKKKKKVGGTKTTQGKDRSSYAPAPLTETIDLGILAWQGNASVTGSGTVITARDDVQLSGPESARGDSSLSPVVIVPVTASGETPREIRVLTPDVRLPDSSLYVVHPESSAGYLVETDPRFANNREWLGSDYMMSQLTRDPDRILRRLGDGYYEQKLIRDQVMALTGQRFLGNYASDEAQYQALMDNGVTFARQYNLVPGVALTPEQMALLTTDMVWMVTQTVTLPDGSREEVLVPQVYARVQPGDVDGSGALLAGRQVALNVAGDLTNSGTLAGRERAQVSAQNISNTGRMDAGALSLAARDDIINTGGRLTGRDGVTLAAGRDIISRSTITTNADGQYIDRLATVFVQNENGTLQLAARNDIRLDATQINSQGDALLQAGHDITLGVQTLTHSEESSFGKDTWRTLTQHEDAGSSLTARGNLTLAAGNNLIATAAALDAGMALMVQADNDVTINAGRSGYHLTEHSKQQSSGLLSGKSLETHDETLVNRATASRLGGDSVTIVSGRDLTVSGSQVIGTQDVALAAGNNLSVTTAEESSQEIHWRQEKKTGLSGTGGIGASYGKQSLKISDTAQDATHRGSTIGSVNGNVTLSAGNALSVHGSELIAGQDMTLAGKNVSITAATDSGTQTHTVEQKTSGLTLALSGAAGGALDSSVRTLQQASETGNDRLAALQAVKGALTIGQGAQSVLLDQATGNQKGNDNTIGVSLSYGSQSSTSTQTSTQATAKGSSLTAGNNLTVVATDGDLLVHGSQLDAQNDLWLQASRDVNLISALNTSTLDGKNESHGGSAGVGIGYGSGGVGFSVSASVNGGKGTERGNGTTHTESLLNAGETLSIVSGRDATLAGAQARGKTVVADIGRNLTLASGQDTDSYDSKQQNISAGGSFSIGSMSGSASVSYSRDRMTSDYASVKEQTGIFAGTGGFDITVGDHTQLDGAVIASTAAADRNRLDTGTLGWTDIHNAAEYDVQHQSAGISTGGSIAGQFAGNMASNLLVGADSSGSAEGTTRSAIENGTVVVRDTTSQTQDVADLSRDTENANGSIDAIFDKEKEQRRMEEAQLIAEIGMQVADIAKTQGEIAKQEAMKDPAALSAAEEKLRGDGKSNPTPQEIADQAGRTAMEQYGTGSDMQRAIQAATAAAQGLAGGDMTAALAGAAAPYVAEIIGHRMGLEKEGKEAEKAAAHAVANAVLAAMQGKDALAGAAGALAGELAGSIALEMYGKDVTALSESEKQTISALATLAAGIAGGVAGDGTASAIAGAQSGKTVVENNSLSLVTRGCAVAAPCRTKVAEQLLEIGAKAGVASLAGKAIKDIADKMTSDELEHLVTLEMMGNDEITSKYLSSLQDKYSPAHTGGDQQSGTEHIGILENPLPDMSKGTSLVTPDQSDKNSFVITVSPESQPGKNDGIYINPRPIENSGTRYVSESVDKNSSASAGDFFKGTTYTDKVKQQASSGDYHSFPESVDSYAGEGKISVITGGDGVERLRLQISGSYRGHEGVFEYIREPNGSINHRLFVPKS